MKKLKCSSCGAELHVEENKEYAVCNHCGARYKLNEDLNINIKLDDSAKEVLNSGLGAFKNISKFMIIPIIAFIIIFIVISIFIFTNASKNRKIVEKSQNQEQSQQEELIEEQLEKAKKDSFNFQFINDNGTKSAFFLESTLDEIIQSNKTKDRLVTLVFDGKETTEESEIIKIKHSLAGNYEVSFDYDNDGYINKIIVNKIK